VPVKRGRCHRHRRSAEHETGARFASFAREAEQDDVGSRRSPGEDPVAVHLVLKPAAVLGSEVQLEEQLEGLPCTLEPTEPIGPNVRLPASGAPCLTRHNSDWCEMVLARWTDNWSDVAEEVGVQWPRAPYVSGDFENALCVCQEHARRGVC